ncbi:hypothetical protein ACFW04_013923 [Cataglyphis niger]
MDYFRMVLQLLETLLILVEPVLVKEYVISSGDSVKFLTYAFGVAHNTVSKIIFAASDGFERLWNFPNCIGAIDIKHRLATVIDAYINYIMLNYNIMIYDIKLDVSAHFETFSIKSIDS